MSADFKPLSTTRPNLVGSATSAPVTTSNADRPIVASSTAAPSPAVVAEAHAGAVFEAQQALGGDGAKRLPAGQTAAPTLKAGGFSGPRADLLHERFDTPVVTASSTHVDAALENVRDVLETSAARVQRFASGDRAYDKTALNGVADALFSAARRLSDIGEPLDAAAEVRLVGDAARAFAQLRAQSSFPPAVAQAMAQLEGRMGSSVAPTPPGPSLTDVAVRVADLGSRAWQIANGTTAAPSVDDLAVGLRTLASEVTTCAERTRPYEAFAVRRAAAIAFLDLAFTLKLDDGNYETLRAFAAQHAPDEMRDVDVQGRVKAALSRHVGEVCSGQPPTA